MESGEEDLLAAPIQFKRMLSWQLSAPIAVPIAKKKQKKKKSKAIDKPPSSPGDDLSLSSDCSDEELVDCRTVDNYYNDKSADCAANYVNSNDENDPEEICYSAQESALTCEDNSGPVTHRASGGEDTTEKIADICNYYTPCIEF